MDGKGPPRSTDVAQTLPASAPGEPASWRWLAVGFGLLAVAFAPALVRTGHTWIENPEYSHGILMPLVAAWLLFERRRDILRLTGGTSVWAIPILIVCFLAMLLGRFDFLTSLSAFAFVAALGALILAFAGWRGVAVFLPALIVLLLACPLPGRLQQAITLPLKEVSSQLAVGLLEVSGIPTYLEGVMIHLEGTDSLWVADACSGIRSFISLVSVAIVACLAWQREWGVKLCIVLAAVPIAILVNGVRIWLTGWLSVHVGPEAAAGAFHFFEGFALFAVAGLLLLGFAGMLAVFFPREAE